MRVYQVGVRRGRVGAWTSGRVVIAALCASAALAGACSSHPEEPPTPAPTTGAALPDSLLHVGATVRVHGSRLGSGWRVGTVVVSAGGHPCLAVKLLPLRGVTPLYLTSASFTEVQADQRTNQGALTLGLPPAEESDWTPVPVAELRRRDAACRRRR